MIRAVVSFPHQRLRKVCVPADPARAHHRTLARSIVETMKALKASGLAANQVFPGELVRIIAVDTREYKGAMFNPKVISSSGEIIAIPEGCLSLDDIYKVPRMSEVNVEFQDMSGKTRNMKFSGINSIIVQHEMDHLDGILARDYFEKENVTESEG